MGIALTFKFEGRRLYLQVMMNMDNISKAFMINCHVVVIFVLHAWEANELAHS